MSESPASRRHLPVRPAPSGAHESLGAHLRARCRLLAPEVGTFFTRLPALAECSPPILLFMQGAMTLDRLHRALLIHGAVARLGVASSVAEKRIASMEFDIERAWSGLRGIYQIELPAHFADYMEPAARILAQAKEGRIIRETDVRGALNLMLNYADELHARLGARNHGSPLKPAIPAANAAPALSTTESLRVMETIGL